MAAQLHTRSHLLVARGRRGAVLRVARAPAQSRLSFKAFARAGAASTSVALSVPQTWKSLRLRLGASNLPHPDKASYGGEDAFFISEVGGGALGVADGVGGWQEEGVNPADYSKAFIATAKRFLEGELNADGTAVEAAGREEEVSAPATRSGEWMGAGPAADPVADIAGSVSGALDAAAGWMERLKAGAQASSSSAAKEEPVSAAQQALAVAHALTRLPGSATACIARLDPSSGLLDAANLGDSGFLLLRGGAVIFRTPALQHYFDCPFQFAATPEHSEVTDSVDDSEVFRLAVQPGDVVVMGSDGLLDNCRVEEICHLVPQDASQVQAAAAALAALAREHAGDPDYESPYTQDAIEEGIDLPMLDKLLKSSFKGGKFQLGKLTGGKMDDITVVVAFVEAA